MDKDQPLTKLGERKIIEEILQPRYKAQEIPYFGNDCAFVAQDIAEKNETIVATTDPCPTPMADHLGYSDLYYWGWLLATLNLSDLAAAGATPLGLLGNYVLPNDTTVGQFESLLDGIDECCDKCDTSVTGGNIKESNEIHLSATAIGSCHKDKLMERTGAQLGDRIVVIGDLGLFWAGVLATKNGLSLNSNLKDELLRNILKPLPKMQVGRELAQKRLLTACMDNSDGLYPSLIQLAEANDERFYLKMDNVDFQEEVQYVSSVLDIDPIRFALGWGDWQLIGTVDPSSIEEVKSVADSHNIPTFIIGEVKEGEGVIINHKGNTGKLMPLDSQRFTKDSWFTSGIEGYIDMLANKPIIINDSY